MVDKTYELKENWNPSKSKYPTPRINKDFIDYRDDERRRPALGEAARKLRKEYLNPFPTKILDSPIPPPDIVRKLIDRLMGTRRNATIQDVTDKVIAQLGPEGEKNRDLLTRAVKLYESSRQPVAEADEPIDIFPFPRLQIR